MRTTIKKSFYSVPSLFRSESTTPKNRIAAIGQTDQVMAIFPVDWYVVTISRPAKKIQIMIISAILYHHFFLPPLFIESSVIRMPHMMIEPESNKIYGNVCVKKRKNIQIVPGPACFGTNAFRMRSGLNAAGTVPVRA